MDANVKAQLEAQKQNCVFCSIVSGSYRSKEVYADERMMGVLDINPGVKGHVIFLPKEHYPLLQFLPDAEFRHVIGKIPALLGGLKKAMLTTGVNLYLANGAAAGQQSPHVLLHTLPREPGDGFFGFAPEKTTEREAESYALLKEHLPKMMRQGNATGEHLYENGLFSCDIPERPWCRGHVLIRPKTDRLIEQLSPEESVLLFQLSSLAASIQFQALEAQGTNILLMSGESDDNSYGKLAVHVVPRWTEDGLQLGWKPLPGKPDLDTLQSRIRDELFPLQSRRAEPSESPRPAPSASAPPPASAPSPSSSSPTQDEIQKAIEEARKREI